MNTLHRLSAISIILLSITGLCQASKPDSCRGKVTFDSVYVVRVSPALATYYLRLIEREDTTGEYTSWNYELRIRRFVEGPILQDICGESGSPFDFMAPDEYPGIEFADLNFDGFPDIKMFNNRAANGINAGYAAYLFNPATEKFSYNEQFSDILGGTGIELDPVKKEITSSGELGCLGRCWSIDTYKVIGDSLILIRRIEQEQDDRHPGEFILVKQEMRNGVLTTISKEKVK